MSGAIQQFALLGEDESARMAMEERHIEALFERADLARNRRLAEIEHFPGMGEAARLGYRVENPQLVPVHHRCAARFPPRVGLHSAALAAASSSSAARKRSASSAAMQPMPAAVTA